MKSLLLVFALVISGPASAGSVARVKLDVDAANGHCLVPVKGEGREILVRNRVQAVMADRGPVPPALLDALGEVVDALARLGDGRFRGHWGASIVIGRKAGVSYLDAASGEIRLNPGAGNKTSLGDQRFGGIANRGLIAHELGHYVSNRDNLALLKRYMRDVPYPCYVTENAKVVYRSPTQTLRREEFAEVFAAYVTNPTLLARRTPACERARRFLGGLFEEGGRGSEGCVSRRAALGEAARRLNLSSAP